MPNTERDRKEHVKHVQEWLCLHGYWVVVDGILGPATEEALRRFQLSNGLLANVGSDSEKTVIELTEPLRAAQFPNCVHKSWGFSRAVADLAVWHEAEHPREVGGQNRGPWVRLYMDGVEGQPWCAGFVSYIIKQAAELLKIEPPIAGSVSCEELAKQAMIARIPQGPPASTLPVPGSIMLVRGGPHRYNHCGIVTDSSEHTFETIEGNTNDHGSPEGYEVCKRIRSYTGKDFICWKS